MQITGQVGAQGPISSGSPGAPTRQGNYGDVIASALNGRYYENAVRGNVFTAAQTAGAAAIAVTTGGATLILYNPAGSGKNLVLLDVIVTIEAETNATQQVAFYLAGNSSGATAAITSTLVNSSIVGNASKGVGQAAATATFTNTAIPLRYLGAVGQAAQVAAVGTPQVCSFKDEIGGALIIPPGSWVGVYALTGGTIGDVTLASSMTWAELSSVVL